MRQDLLFVRLLSFALSGGEPPDCREADMKLLYGFARLHGVEGLLFRALSSAEVKAPDCPEVYACLKKAALITSDRYIRRSTEEMYVLGVFEGAGIDCMPVKGAQLAACYPSEDLRDSCDSDILISPFDKKAADRLMLSLGYQRTEVGITESTYKKPSGFVFELHTALDEEALPESIEKPVSQFTLKDGCAHIHAMSAEEAYIYLICHAAKHLRSSGCGIRFAADAYMLRKKYILDFDYISSQLNQVGLCEFDASLLSLCSFWFENAVANDTTERFAAFVLSSGKYGTPRNAALISKARSPETGKYAHFGRRLFPSYSQMIKTRPYLKKYPILLPAAWLGRIIKSVPIIGHKAKTEVTAYDSADGEKVAQIKTLFKEIGL